MLRELGASGLPCPVEPLGELTEGNHGVRCCPARLELGGRGRSSMMCTSASWCSPRFSWSALSRFTYCRRGLSGSRLPKHSIR